MATPNITCTQIEYLINALSSIECSEQSSQEPISGFQSNLDPENEVIFDPENEVIFDPENEVIFDPQQILNPDDSQYVLDGFQNIYDSYGHRINLLKSKKELVKLLYWVFTYEQNQSIIQNNCSQ